MYTGTCAIYNSHHPTGDGNTGWSCYNKYEKNDFGYLKQSAIESMAADTEEDEDDYVIKGEEDEDDYVIKGEPADDDEKNEEDLFVF